MSEMLIVTKMPKFLKSIMSEEEFNRMTNFPTTIDDTNQEITCVFDNEHDRKHTEKIIEEIAKERKDFFMSVKEGNCSIENYLNFWCKYR